MLQLLVRFIVGGLIVSLFAALGTILKPKSFAGLFGAAPSVALATLGLTIASDGRSYAVIEARSMILGAAAFCLYATLCSRLMMRNEISASTATISALALRPVFAIGTWAATHLRRFLVGVSLEASHTFSHRSEAVFWRRQKCMRSTRVAWYDGSYFLL